MAGLSIGNPIGEHEAQRSLHGWAVVTFAAGLCAARLACPRGHTERRNTAKAARCHLDFDHRDNYPRPGWNASMLGDSTHNLRDAGNPA